MAKEELVIQSNEQILEECNRFLRAHDEQYGGDYCATAENGQRIAAYVRDHFRERYTQENLEKAYSALNKQLKLIRTREGEALLSSDEAITYYANNGIRKVDEFGKFAGHDLPPRREVQAPRPRQDARVHSLSESRVSAETPPWERGETLSPRQYANLSSDDLKRLHVYLESNNIPFSKVVR